jgi:hypothetical protein
MKTIDQLRKRQEKLREDLCPECLEKMKRAKSIDKLIEGLKAELGEEMVIQTQGKIRKAMNANGDGKQAAIVKALLKAEDGVKLPEIVESVQREGISLGDVPKRSAGVALASMIRYGRVKKKGSGPEAIYFPTAALRKEAHDAAN